jgi:hypothetical protein
MARSTREYRASDRERLTRSGLFIYDGACGFCVFCSSSMSRWTPFAAFVPSQEMSDESFARLSVTRVEAMRGALYQDSTGSVHHGADAFIHLLTDAN